MRRPPLTDALVAASPSGEVVFWGRGAQQIFGYSPAEMVGQPLSTIVRLPRLRSGGTFRVDAMRKGGETFRAGIVVEPIDKLMSIVIRDESRWSLLADFADVVTQHASFADAAPRIAELIGRAYAFDAVAIWSTEVEPPQRTVWWSGSGVAVRKSALVERVRESGERATGSNAIVLPILDRSRVVAVLELFCGPDGDYGPPILDELSRLADLAGRFMSRERFAVAHELSNAGVFEGAHASDHLYRMLGLAPQSRVLTLRWFLRHVEAADRERLRSAIDVARQYGALDVRLRFKRDDGETRHLRVQAKMNGPRAVGNITDVTEEQRESRRLTGLGQLAATMAHEFKNVLMGISTFAEVLRRRTAGEVHVQNAVAQIQQTLARGRRITDEVLRFTREPAPVLAPIDVRRWLTDFLPEASALTNDRAVAEIDSDLFVRGDVALLNQVLANLIINARDAAPEGPIRISARRISDDRLDLVVSDRGNGIPAEVLDRMFEPLFTTKRGGTGLGLPVVQQVVTAHGGTIEVDTEAGRGTQIHVRLPLVRGEAGLGDAQRVTRVLLVEDDPAVTLALVAVLESEEIDVRTATSGAAALSAIERQVPQVVLLDIGLPDISGADVYGEIAGRWPQLPVVFITAELDDSAVARFLRRPHIGFLRKPFEAEQLLDTLSRITAVKRSDSGRNSGSGRRTGSTKSK